MERIRPVGTADAEAICRIYAPAIIRQDVATSFETQVPSVDEMAGRIESKTRFYPWLVFEQDERIAGYAYADPHRARAAYQWSAEVSVYIDAAHHRQGVGRKLYEALFAILRRQGVVNLYAGITLPNPGSVGLHESLGFEPVGVYKDIGFKFGRTHDVGWWHKRVQSWPGAPAPLIPVVELDVADILNNRTGAKT